MRRWATISRGVLPAAVALLVAAGLICGGCQRKKDDRTVRVIGSTSIQPFAEMLAEEFNGSQGDVYVEVQGGGSTAGLQAVDSGYAQIGMCSRSLKPQEQFNSVTVAYDGVAVVVNNLNPIRGLSRRQIADIFAGNRKFWTDDQLGGPPWPIRLITREEGSGTREAFTTMVMDYGTGQDVKKLHAPYASPTTMPDDVKKAIDRLLADRPRITMYSITEPSNGSVKALVSGDKAAIGYMSLGQVGTELRSIEVDGIVPNARTVLEEDPGKRYPLVRPFLFVYRGEMTPSAKKFVDYVLSKEAQDLLTRKGLVRVDAHVEE